MASTRHQQKRHGKHQKHTRPFLKVYSPYLPMMIIVIVAIVLSIVSPTNAKVIGSRDVLSYATSMSSSELLTATNQERTSRGKTALKINSKLASAAQAKANDMVSKDYWSHDPPGCPAPDTCWYKFVVSAGYNYSALAENLAYGFANGSDTVDGWMGSTTHRTNMLNSTYTEVGFGYKNSINFVGKGQQTVVVAEYGKPASTPVSTPLRTTPKPAVASATSTNTSTSTPTTATSQKNYPKKPVNTTKIIKDSKPVNVSAYKQPTESITQRTNAVSAVTGRNINGAISVASALAFTGIIVLLARHTITLRTWFKRGEKYVMHHPAFDLTVLAFIGLLFIASQTVGYIK